MQDLRLTLGLLLVSTPVLVPLIIVLLRAGKNQHQLRVQRLQVLQDALEHPALDERTRAELTRVLADDYRRKHGPVGERFGRLLRAGQVVMLALGWLLLIGGISFWIWAENDMFGPHEGVGIVATVAGFALLTLPLAMRELLGRRDRNAAAPQP